MRKSSNRTHNMLTNSAVGVLATLLQTVLNYAVRIVLIRELGPEVNGLHNLFQSLASVMAFVETGFGTAMIAHLYKPVEDENKEQIRSILAFYRKIYIVISASFLAIGIFTDIFLIKKIVSTTIPLGRVRLYFLIFIISFVGNYATYYKRSILFAEQKNRVSICATLISELFFRSAQIISAVIWHNYAIFLTLMILEKICSNMACNIYIDYHRPYLRNLRGVQTDNKLKQSVYNMVKPLLVFNISSTVQQSSKSILISSLLGNIKIVGYFGNYSLVTGAFSLLFSQFGAAYTSAFGNLAICGNTDEMYEYYEKVSWLINWGAIIAAAGILSCVQPFINFTFGEDFLLPLHCVLLLLIDMLCSLFAIPVVSIQNAMGLHNKDEKFMVLQAASSVIFGYIGGKFFGMEGLLIGSTLPSIMFTLIHKGCAIFPVAFSRSGEQYIILLTKTIVKAFAVVAVNYYVCAFIHTGMLAVDFLLRGTMTIVFCGLLFAFSILYRKRSLNMKK